jgi:hypothetical protein
MEMVRQSSSRNQVVESGMINRILVIVFISILPCQNSMANFGANVTRRSDYTDFAQSIVVSQAVFTFVNAILFREQLAKKQVNILTVAGISAIEVAENVINFVQIETLSRYGLPFLELGILLYLRAQMPPQAQQNSFWFFFVEGAASKIIKNKVNFMVTENWYPKRWLLP